MKKCEIEWRDIRAMNAVKRFFINIKDFFMEYLVVYFIMLVFIVGLILSFSYAYHKGQEVRAQEKAQEAPLVLTEKEMDYWMEVYTAAVRRGVWNPARRANWAIIELRERQGE